MGGDGVARNLLANPATGAVLAYEMTLLHNPGALNALRYPGGDFVHDASGGPDGRPRPGLRRAYAVGSGAAAARVTVRRLRSVIVAARTAPPPRVSTPR